MNDNIYPNDGRFYAPVKQPSAQAKAKELETNETLAQLPVLEEIVKHFDEQIASFDSIDSVSVKIKDPQELVNTIAANKLAKAKLQAERSYILARVERLKR